MFPPKFTSTLGQYIYVGGGGGGGGGEGPNDLNLLACNLLENTLIGV